VIGILPGRLATRQRLMIGALIVVIVSILNLVTLDAGPIFGSPWPIALVWAVCGWSKLGANLATASLIFALGCWVDLLTGSVLGTWACAGLITMALTLGASTYLGLNGLSPVMSCTVSGFFLLIVLAILGLLQNQQSYFFGNILSIMTAIGLYPLISKFFELSEDET
jgi:hypothetical protein